MRTLFPGKHTPIVNVAKIPQRSPFRYPGGKTWLVPEIRGWLKALGQRPRQFIEPFAGGGIASLTAICENLADSALMVEKDENVAAVWQVILNDADWLAERIRIFELTLENVHRVLDLEPTSLRERAFQAILRNRVQRGGIMAPGASLMKAGENGRGIASRWYPGTLVKRIRAIHAYRHRINFIEGDAWGVIPKYLIREDAVFFIDPPYTAGGKRAGKRLYVHNEIDHAALFEMMAQAKGEFLMTYDESEEIKELARNYGFFVAKVSMKNTHHAKLFELLIFPNPLIAKKKVFA